MQKHNDGNATTANPINLADEIRQPENQLAIWLRLQAYNHQMRD